MFNLFEYPEYRYFTPVERTYYWTNSAVKTNKPNTGEYWYVKMPGAQAVQRVYVMSSSAHTVLLTKTKTSHHTEGTRYITDEVTWVEQALDDDRD